MTVNCDGCSKPILPGEPRYTYMEPDKHWHYSCAEKAHKIHDPFTRADTARVELRKSIDNFKQALDNVGSRIRRDRL